jgi:hypothetical protein
VVRLALRFTETERDWSLFLSASSQVLFARDSPLYQCVVRSEAASTTWAAFVLLDRIIGNNDGDKVVPYVIHVSVVLLRLAILLF